MRALSLFTGVGGLDLAAAACGIEVAAMCECDAFCRAVLEKRFAGIPVAQDVKEVEGDEWGAVGAVFGGFPCQDLSLAGANRDGGRKGLEGERSGLWFEMLRIVHRARPAWVLAENVRGATSLALDTVRAGLEDAGYAVRALVIPASALGAPHQRERLFVVGMRRDLHERLECLPDWREKAEQEREGMPRAEPPRLDRWKDTDNAGSLGAGWLEQMMGFPEGWTDLDCDNPQGWAGFPAPMSGGTNWATPVSSDCKRIDGSGFRSTCSDVLQEARLFATPIASDATGSRCKLHRSVREDIWQIRHGEISSEQYPWELPRLERGETKKRKQRIKALGNAVVPQQAYPLFKAIVEIEEALA